MTDVDHAPRPPGVVVWITGPPAAGKSTAARALLALLEDRGRVTLALDSDELRQYLTPAATYSDAERDDFYLALAHLARLGASGGAVVIVSATAALARWRDRARELTPRFCEVYLRCDHQTLRTRDTKGLYARAERGEIPRLPGVGVPYEEPVGAELELDSAVTPPHVVAERVLDWLEVWSLGEAAQDML